MSSEGPYSRYAGGGGQAGYGGGYGGAAPGYGGQGYGGGAPGYGGGAYSAPAPGGYGQQPGYSQAVGANENFGYQEVRRNLLYQQSCYFARFILFKLTYSFLRIHSDAQEDASGKKGAKKSMALAALNKNVYMWAGFFSASLFVYFTLSGGDFSFLMTYGAMSRMFGFGILNAKIFMSKRATGVSVKSLQLYSLVFFFRLTSIMRHEGYLPYDKSGDWLYHIIEVSSLLLSISAMYGALALFKDTYQPDQDKFGEMNVPPGYGAVYLAVPVLLLAIFIHPNLNSDFISDVAWTYAMYLESVALVPQLFMFQKQSSGVVELLTAHFVAALGFGRVMEFLFWIYSYHELATSAGSKLPGYLALFSQFMQLVLMLDFFWYYYLAVKNATPLVLPSHGAALGIV